MSSTEKVRWGFLAAGDIARVLLGAMPKTSNAETVAVAARDVARAQAVADEFGVPHACTYDELLQRPEIEAVYISTPNSLHAEWSHRAARAGKHVLCEKSFAANADEAAAMFQTAREQNVQIMEAFMYRLHPQWNRVREIIQSGELGTLRRARSSFGFVLNNSGDIRMQRDLAGGALMDVGCYCLSFSRLMARFANAGEPSETFAAAQFADKNGVDETLLANLRFENGFAADFVGSFLANLTSAEVVGTNGKIEIPNPWFAGESATLKILIGDQTREETVVGGDNYVAEIEQFSRCIRAGEPPFIAPEETLGNMKTIDALLQSARERRSVSL